MLATFMGLRPPRRPPRRLQDGPRWLSRRLRSPKPAQDASKPAPKPSRPRFLVDFGWFLVDVWSILVDLVSMFGRFFGRCLVDFWSIYITFFFNRGHLYLLHQSFSPQFHRASAVAKIAALRRIGYDFRIIWSVNYMIEKIRLHI